MKYLLLIASLFFIYSTEARCQSDSIQISGQIDSTVTNFFKSKVLIVRVRKTTNRFNPTGKTFTVPINDDGNFKLSFKPDNTFTYLEFMMIKPNASNNALNLSFISRANQQLDEVYLFEKGDKIKLNIKNGGTFYFDGEASPKLRCEAQMYSMDERPGLLNLLASDLANSKQYEQRLILNNQFSDLVIKSRLAILNSYKEKVSKDVYNILSLDAVGSAQYQFIREFQFNTWLSPKSVTVPLTQKYFEFFLQNYDYPKVDTNYMAQSGYYADMLFLRELNTFQLYKNLSADDKNTYSFKDVYAKIKKRYHGELRDKLILISYETLAKKYPVEAKLLITDALATMKDEVYKDILASSIWNPEKMKFFPFDLPDVDGNYRKLTDYTGKIVVVDFWYNGCGWCRSVNTAMKPIVKYFEKNKNVVFITINIDSKKETWLNGVSSGAYTSSKSVNLYTNGLGAQHPIIKYYGFNGYPQQMIINKIGELIIANPPRVDQTPTGFVIDSKTPQDMASANTKSFIKIIEDNL